MKRFSFKKTIILAVILTSPGFCYYLLTLKGKNRYKPLPVYGAKEVAKTTHKVMGKEIADTTYHHLSDFKLWNQYNDSVTLQSFDKKIIVAGFFYSQGPPLCEDINKNIEKIATNYSKNSIISFLSITVDPARDSVGALKIYADRFNADKVNWQFLTGDTATIYPLATKGFMVNAVAGGEKSELIFSEMLVLVDFSKRIRGYYNGTSTAEVARLNDEIKVLIAEELRNMKIPY
ncbi:MAG: SCO family protein [Sphingobacteriaceae bacterium]